MNIFQNDYLNIVVIVNQVFIHTFLKYQLSEDSSQFFPSWEYTNS